MSRLPELDRTQRALIGLALGLVILLGINIFSNVAFRDYQLDLTEEKLFTVSDATRSVLASIDEPVTVRLFFTKDMGKGNPEHARYFTRVSELLERYTLMSNGKLRLELYDAAPFSEAEDHAVTYGLRAFPFNQAGDLGYFGIVGTNSTDDVQAIPYLAPERDRFLEYDLTKLVHQLVDPEKRTVGLISSLPIGGAGPVPFHETVEWAVVSQLREFFDLQPLPSYVEQIPDHIDALVVVHPKGFDDYALYAIDQYVLRGGHVLVFVDPFVESGGKLGINPMQAARSEFDSLLNAWGLSLVPDKVAGDLDAARRVHVRHEGRIAAVDYLPWLALTPVNFAAGDVTTADIRTLNLGSAGILQPLGTPGVAVTPLLETGARSMAIDLRKVAGRVDAIELFRSFRPDNTSYMIAARVTGRPRSAFPAAPAVSQRDGNTAPHLAAASTDVNVIVVADVDMLHDEFWAERRQDEGREVPVPIANNVDFVINALDNLTGSAELVSLRSRRESLRPFHMIERIRQDAERRFRQKERELQDRLERARAEIETMSARDRADGPGAITAAERARFDALTRELVATRRELRDVQQSLRNDLDRLDALLKFANIAAIPLMLTVGVMGATFVRRRTGRRPPKQ